MQIYVALQAYRPSDEFSRGNQDPASLSRVARRNRLLKCFRAVSLVVANGAEFRDIKLTVWK